MLRQYCYNGLCQKVSHCFLLGKTQLFFPKSFELSTSSKKNKVASSHTITTSESLQQYCPTSLRNGLLKMFKIAAH